MDLDEYIFASLKAWNEKWTNHSSDSESSSDSEAEKGGVIAEVKEEIALQKVQLASQQEELMRQKDQLERQNGELAMRRDTMQTIQDTLAVSAASLPQSPSNESETMISSELEDPISERDSGNDGLVNDFEELASEGLDLHREEEEEIRIPSDTERH